MITIRLYFSCSFTIWSEFKSFIDLICNFVFKQYALFGKLESWYYVIPGFSRRYRWNFILRFFSLFVLKPSLDSCFKPLMISQKENMMNTKEIETITRIQDMKTSIMIFNTVFSYWNTYIRLMMKIYFINLVET